ncbi:MAG: hypothetical protein AABY79_06700 [Nitrospirota bacterium]|jgi:hypothetical protein
MKLCALCKKEAVVDKYFTKKSVCPHCKGDLHICLNCRFYSETSHNKCLEPNAEFQRVRDKANLCEYFAFKETNSIPPDREKEEAGRRLDELFKK